MYDHGVSALSDELSSLVAADVATADGSTLRDLADAASRVRSWLDAFDVRLVARANELAGRDDTATALLRHRGRRAATAVADRTRTVTAVPQMGEALATGQVSAAHLDVLGQAAATLDEEGQERLAGHGAALAASAATMTPERFGRECRDLARNLAGDGGVGFHERVRALRKIRRWIDHTSGLANTMLSLDPLTDAKVWTAFNAAIDRARAGGQAGDASWDHVQVDAVVDLVLGARDGATTADRLPEVSVLIDLETLTDGLHEHGIAETSDGRALPVATIRRLAC